MNRAWTLLAVLLLAALAARAHDPGLSALALRLQPDGVDAVVSLAKADADALAVLDSDHNGRVEAMEFERNRPALEQIIAGALQCVLDGRPTRSTRIHSQLGPGEGVQIELTFPGRPTSSLRVSSALPGLMPRGHRQYLTLEDAQGRPLANRMLDADDGTFETSTGLPSPASIPGGPGQFVGMGIEHILSGYDHLAFLFGLLIVGATFGPTVKIITSFTVAHSLTLGLATLNALHLPSSIVEPLIALSIVYVGVENLLRRDLKNRWRLTFLFGLIHGCGFATALREVGVGSAGPGVLLPLLSFNLGVELGQMALAAVILPVLWKLRTREHWQVRAVPACSIVISLLGAYWLASRVFSGA